MEINNPGLIMPQRRQLPKLVACMTKTSLENARNKALYGVDLLDAKGIRRRKLPLHECLILELREAGYTESSNYLQDLLYDNAQLVAADDIGIVVDLRKREDYLEDICHQLQTTEKQREKEQTKKECLSFLNLAQRYAEKGKGILWLAEKFYLAAIAVGSQYLIDGGRLKGCCKYYYAKFLLDKFPFADTDEAFLILTEVRDSSIGKSWPLQENEDEDDVMDHAHEGETLFCATAIQLHRVLLHKSKLIVRCDPAKAERLARLAERRARDARDQSLLGEAVMQVGVCQLKMNNLNNALKTFERALKINMEINNVTGMCETRMHWAAVMQRLNDFEMAALLLTEAGTQAMDYGLRWHLGRALHLLGELHLRRERPELGTQHLAEAFSCFMGFHWTGIDSGVAANAGVPNQVKSMAVVYSTQKNVIYEEESEQSRLMMAISASQELMPYYYNLLRESWDCAVARTKVIEWKLLKAGWWVNRMNHDLIPCMCKIHNRTALDAMWVALERKMQVQTAKETESEYLWLERDYTIEDIQKLQSSYLLNIEDHLSHTTKSVEQIKRFKEKKEQALRKTAENKDEEKKDQDNKDEEKKDQENKNEEKKDQENKNEEKKETTK